MQFHSWHDRSKTASREDVFQLFSECHLYYLRVDLHRMQIIPDSSCFSCDTMASSGAPAIDGPCQTQLALTLTSGRDWQKPRPWARAPGGHHSTFSSPFGLLIYRPQWPCVDPFPLSVCSQGTPKTVPQQYICFMISWGAREGKQAPAAVKAGPGTPRSRAVWKGPVCRRPRCGSYISGGRTGQRVSV